MAHVSSIKKTKSDAQLKGAKPVTAAKKTNSVEKTLKKVVSAPKIKQTKIKPANLKIKAKSQKPALATLGKKSDTVAVKKKSATPLPVEKKKSKVLKTKVSAVKKTSIKSQAKVSIKKSKPVKSQRTEARKKNTSAKSNVSIKKKVSAKSPTSISAKKTNLPVKKTAPKIARNVAVKSIKAQAVPATKKTKTVKSPTIVKAKKNAESQPIAANKKIKFVKVQTGAEGKKRKVETAKPKEITASKTIKNKSIKAVEGKKQKPKSFERIGINTRKYNLLRKEKPQRKKESSKAAGKEVKQSANKISAQNKTLIGKIRRQTQIKAIDDNKIELKNLPPELIISKPKKKKARAISAAVFRGKKERYDFDVFPLDAEFEDASAIYIISKRILDKRKKAHHALICIGQTESLLAELKKHKKGKCFKKFAANSISLLREENEKRRLRIETDLKAAHTIPCLHI